MSILLELTQENTLEKHIRTIHPEREIVLAGASDSAVYWPHFVIPGSISEATIGPIFVGNIVGQTLTLIKVRHILSAGTCDFVITKNGADISGTVSASTTKGEKLLTVPLSDADELRLVTSNVSSAEDLSVGIYIRSRN